MSTVNFVEVKNLKKYFGGGGLIRKKPLVRAVDGISFSINRGETFGLGRIRLRKIYCCSYHHPSLHTHHRLNYIRRCRYRAPQ